MSLPSAAKILGHIHNRHLKRVSVDPRPTHDPRWEVFRDAWLAAGLSAEMLDSPQAYINAEGWRFWSVFLYNR